jgi:hypothetical protein
MMLPEELEAFAALVAVYASEKSAAEAEKDFEAIVLPAAIAAEREACAKVCVAVAERNIWWDINEIEAAVECAAAIRERGETE